MTTRLLDRITRLFFRGSVQRDMKTNKSVEDTERQLVRADELLDAYESELKLYRLRVARLERDNRGHIHS